MYPALSQSVAFSLLTNYRMSLRIGLANKNIAADAVARDIVHRADALQEKQIAPLMPWHGLLPATNPLPNPSVRKVF